MKIMQPCDAGVIAFTPASVPCFRQAQSWVLAATILGSSLAFIGASFGERDRGRAIGTWSGFTAITTAVGPVLGGALIEHASWRWVFFINLPIAAAVVILTLWRVPESRNSQVGVRPDWPGS